MTSGSCTTPSRIPLPHIPSGIDVVGLAALNMVQLWADLDVAGVGLAFAHLMAVISPCVRMLDLMRVYTVLRSRVARLWIISRLALAARCG